MDTLDERVWVFEMKRMFREDSGFTIAEYVMAAAILLFVSIAVMGTLAYAATASQGNTRREQALSLANQRLEQARNMLYDKVGTTTGYPTGDIPGTETVEGFTVDTDISWALDSGTNLSSCKTIQITVSWGSPRAGSLSIESNIAGKSSIANAGDVKINVVDDDTGLAIQGSSITIKPSTGLTATRSTDASGSVRWGKVPAGNILITGTCPGYALDIAPLSAAAVISGILNEWTVKAIKPSTAKITVLDASKTAPNNKLPGVVVSVTGPSGTLTATSDSAGVATITGLLKGTYSVDGVIPGYKSVPTSLGVLLGGQTYSGSLTMNKNAKLTVTVTDQNGAPVAGVALTSSPALTAPMTDVNGQSVIDVATGGVSYAVIASKSGYSGNSGTTGVIAPGANATLAITINELKDGTLVVKFTFAKNDASSYLVRVYDGTHAEVDNFTVQKPTNNGGTDTTSRTLPAGQYSVSRYSSWTSSANNAPYLNAGSTVTVNMTKSD